MPITKDQLRIGGSVVLGVLATVAVARLVYGAPSDDPAVVLPPVLTIESDDPSVPEVETAAQVIDRLESGDLDLVGVMTLSGSDQEFDEFEATIGRTPDIIQLSIGWELDDFDPSVLTRITDRGALPSISWEPWDFRPDIADQPDYALARILDGEYDDYIDEWANGLASTEQPVILRFGHEANGDWYPWAEARNGNSSGEFVATWRYLHDRFTQAGADNVIWMWSPNVNPRGKWPMTGVFPGDDYIDLVGLVGYWGHFGETPTEVGTFESVFGGSVDEIRSMTAKPILISETAASDEGGFKAEWIEEFLIEVGARPDIVGFVWFEANKEDDWRVGSTPDSLASFLEGLTQPAFDR